VQYGKSVGQLGMQRDMSRQSQHSAQMKQLWQWDANEVAHFKSAILLTTEAGGAGIPLIYAHFGIWQGQICRDYSHLLSWWTILLLHDHCINFSFSCLLWLNLLILLLQVHP
jgi:hypothetical protein